MALWPFSYAVNEGNDDFLRVWELGLFLGLGLEVFVKEGHLCGRGGRQG